MIWTPARLSGCVLGLDAGVGVTLTSGLVSAWQDLSGLWNSPVQATSGRRPSPGGSINGRPGITFAAGTGLDGPAALMVSASARTTIAAVQGGGVDDGLSGGAIIAMRNTGPGGVYWESYFLNSGSSMYGYSNGVGAGAFVNAAVIIAQTPHVVSHMTDGSLSAPPAFWIDGAGFSLSAPNVTADSNSGTFTVGNRSAYDDGFVGSIGGLWVWNRALSDNERKLVEQYLSNRFLIPIQAIT